MGKKERDAKKAAKEASKAAEKGKKADKNAPAKVTKDTIKDGKVCIVGFLQAFVLCPSGVLLGMPCNATDCRSSPWSHRVRGIRHPLVQ